LTPIYDITPFTALDFAGKLSAIIWFAGCNLRCAYCYNPHIVFGKGTISIAQVAAFLQKRRGLLEGVVMSGGEPTSCDSLIEICAYSKKIGYMVKLDTNGSNPDVLTKLLADKLLDFVSLDFKSTKEKWRLVAGGGSFDTFLESLDLLLASKVPFEVRTTVHPELLSDNDVRWMGEFLKRKGYDKRYYLQPYKHTDTIKKIKEPVGEWRDGFNKIDAIWR